MGKEIEPRMMRMNGKRNRTANDANGCEWGRIANDVNEWEKK
jgi:hypothetical protein